MPTTKNKKAVSANLPPAYLTPPIRELGRLERLSFKLTWNYRIRYAKRLLSIKNKEFLKGPVRLTEALSMDFIARNTTIPVPRVLDVFTIDGHVYMIQEYIDGPVLEDVWHTLLPEEQRSSMAQLKDCLDQLRALEPPYPERVQAIDGSACLDLRVASSDYGPFDNHYEFHKFLGHEVFRDYPDRYPLVQDALSKVSGRRYKSVFSHGDLGPHNVLWKDGKIYVIDWECSGWFPEYWDYTRTYQVTGFRKPLWWQMFKETVAYRYDDEVELHRKVGNYIEHF